MKPKKRRSRRVAFNAVETIKSGNVNKFYKSTDWDVAREAALLRDRYECQRCNGNWNDGVHKVNKITITTATTVHHKIAIRDNADKALDLDNLVSLCHNCHEVIEEREAFRFKRKIPVTKERW